MNFYKFDFLNNCYALDNQYVSSSCNISFKLVKLLLRYRKSLNISLVWHTNGYLRFFGCFGVKNRKKWNHSVVSSLYECTDLELKLQWLIRIVASNFIKIIETIDEISHLTIFFKRQHPLSWFFDILLFEQLLCSGYLICVIMKNFIKIG